MRHLQLVLTASALVFSAQTALAQAPRAYDADDLGTLGGAMLLAAAMNSNGDIVGSGTTADGSQHAFRWTRTGGLEDLGMFGGIDAQATGINDAGDIVGLYFDDQWISHAFFLPAGGTTIQPLDDVFQPSAVSANGWFTGMSGGSRAFRATDGAPIQELTDIIGFGYAINGGGDTAGASFHGDWSKPTGPTAFRYTGADGFVELGTFGGSSSYGFGINATGTVVGGAATPAGPRHAFRALPGQPLQDLGILFPNAEWSETIAYGVNDAGDVVGQAGSTEQVVPFRYTDGTGLVNLSPLIPLAIRLNGRPYLAQAINANQQILLIYTDWAGEFRSALLRPRTDVPAPTISAVSADPAVLSPPNGEMIPVTITVYASDDYDGIPPCRITRVIDSAARFGHPHHDVEMVDDYTVYLRARLDHHHDHTYTVFVTCTNSLGGSAEGSTLVQVPRP